MKDVIIVDNSPNAYFFHPENAVPILSWYDDGAALAVGADLPD